VLWCKFPSVIISIIITIIRVIKLGKIRVTWVKSPICVLQVLESVLSTRAPGSWSSYKRMCIPCV
jgi:hypothetical protein